MKQIVDVRCGQTPILRVYQGEQLIWERRASGKPIAHGHSVIYIESEAISDTTYCANTAMADNIYLISAANSDTQLCSSVGAQSFEKDYAIGDLEQMALKDYCGSDEIHTVTIANGDGIGTSQAKSSDSIVMFVVANADTNVRLTNGMFEIIISGDGEAKSAHTEPVASTEEINFDTMGEAHNHRAIPVHSAETINVSGIYVAKNSSVNPAYSVSYIKENARAVAESGIEHEIYGHGVIVTSGIGDGRNAKTTDMSARGDVVVRGGLVASDINIHEAISRETIDMDANIADADKFATVGAESKGSINTNARADTATWIIPTLNGGTLTIIQAFDVNDENIPILEVI